MGMTDIPALKDDVLESWISPIPVELSAWYLEGAPPVDHMDRLRNKTVILIGGYTYAGLRDWLTANPISELPKHRTIAPGSTCSNVSVAIICWTTGNRCRKA